MTCNKRTLEHTKFNVITRWHANYSLCCENSAYQYHVLWTRIYLSCIRKSSIHFFMMYIWQSVKLLLTFNFGCLKVARNMSFLQNLQSGYLSPYPCLQNERFRFIFTSKTYFLKKDFLKVMCSSKSASDETNRTLLPLSSKPTMSLSETSF